VHFPAAKDAIRGDAGGLDTPAELKAVVFTTIKKGN